MAEKLNELITSALSSIKGMVDVSTVVGEAITAPDGTIVIPVTQVSCGFGTGGSEIPTGKMNNAGTYPFGGGSGGGVKIKPVAFLVIAGDKVRLIPVTPENSTSVDKILELVPDMIEKVNSYIKHRKELKAKGE